MKHASSPSKTTSFYNGGKIKTSPAAAAAVESASSSIGGSAGSTTTASRRRGRSASGNGSNHQIMNGVSIFAPPVLFVLVCLILVNFYLLEMHHGSHFGILPDYHHKKKNKKKERELQKQRERNGEAADEAQLQARAASLLPNATFSACLLIKDDNDILNEWIAYHYFTLNMRQLLVAVDPTSNEWPSSILKKWRQLTDLQVYEWRDEDYMPQQFLTSKEPPAQYKLFANNFSFPGNISFPLTNETLLQISSHRYRQRVFLAKCMQHLRSNGASWMIHTDTDEFIISSKLFRQMSPKYVEMPSMETPGSVLNLLQQVVNKTARLVNYPCISLLRVLFGSVESADVSLNVPPGFDGHRFETLRWRHHGVPRDNTLNGNPKVILDMAAIPPKYFPNTTVFSIHRPVTQYCRKNSKLAFGNFRKQPIAANHYLGSWERYSSKIDNRRSRAVYDVKANMRKGQDDGTRLWLQGFVKSTGLQLAAKLLGRDYLTPEFAEQQQLTER